MPYYHVLLSFRDAPNSVRCLFSDLSEKDLKTRFLVPYRKGQKLLCNSEVVVTSEISKVTVIRTADTSVRELAKIQEASRRSIEELNRSSRGVVFFGGSDRGHALEHIIDAGEDVTAA